MKRALKRKYQESGHHSKNIDKEIVFYCDNNPITNENEEIGNIAVDAEVKPCYQFR